MLRWVGIPIALAAVGLAHQLLGAARKRRLQIEGQQLDERNRAVAADKLSKAVFVKQLEALKASLEGSLITPNDTEAYMEARTRPFHHDMRGFPLVIVRPKSTTDVVKVVNFVRSFGNGIVFCITCGGHSSRCMRTDSFVLDLVNICEVKVDLEKSTAAVGGGAYLRALDEAIAPHGLGVTVGTYPWTGVGGLVLAGGYGWLGRILGTAVDNLVEVEAVLADGRVVVANDNNEHASLIWGFRGGGGNFGIVTKFVFKLHKLPPRIYGGSKVFLTPTAASSLQVLTNYDKLTQELPTSLQAVVVVVGGGAPVVPILCSYFGDHPTVKSVPELNAMSKLGGWFMVEDSVKPISYHFGIQTMTSANVTSGLIYTTLVPIGSFTAPLPDTAFPELLAHTRKRLHWTLTSAVAIFFPMGGKYATADDGSKTSVGELVRKARYLVILECRWKEGTGDAGKEAARAWCQEADRVLSKYRSLTAIMHAPDSVNDAELPAHDLGFAEGVWARLTEVKRSYDPANFFNQNANIPPAPAAK